MNPEVHYFGGVPLTLATAKWAADYLTEPSAHHKAVHLVNAYTLHLAQKSKPLKELLNSENAINLLDSKWLTIAMRTLTDTPIEQVRGPSLMSSLFKAAQEKPLIKVFLLGGSEYLLSRMADRLSSEFVNVNLVGSLSPDFRDLSQVERHAIIMKVQSTEANLVLVGLGTPKQDFWVEEISEILRVKALAVGAAFDFFGGTKVEAPKILSALGLEWAFRLVTEPKRLWRRYLFGNITFFRLWMKELIRK